MIIFCPEYFAHSEQEQKRAKKENIATSQKKKYSSGNGEDFKHMILLFLSTQQPHGNICT